MEELLRLELDHQQLHQQKVLQRQQQQQLEQRAKAAAMSMSMSMSMSSATTSASSSLSVNSNNYDNSSSQSSNNNYDNIYNTTNSLIGDNIAKRPTPHQLINPPSSPAKQLCAEQVLLSAASLLQNQIHRSAISTKSSSSSADPMSVSSDASSISGPSQGQSQGSQASRKTFSEFNAIPSLPIDCGGPCHPSQISPTVLEREMNTDESMYDEILTGRVPTIDTIHRFMCYLNHRAGFSTECNVIALMYVNRITLVKSAVSVTTHSWRALWAIAVIVAQKFWEPIPVRTSSFASILPSMSKELLRSLELKLLDHLGFNTTMEPEMYEHYCQELKALFYTVRGHFPHFSEIYRVVVLCYVVLCCVVLCSFYPFLISTLGFCLNTVARTVNLS